MTGQCPATKLRRFQQEPSEESTKSCWAYSPTTFTSRKPSYLLGLFFGSTFVGLINRDLNEQKYGSKEKRDLINRFRDLKEEYKKNHDDAVNEIDYIFALNDNLWSELDNGKKLIKNKS